MLHMSESTLRPIVVLTIYASHQSSFEERVTCA